VPGQGPGCVQPAVSLGTECSGHPGVRVPTEVLMSFGAELRRQRLAAGLSLGGLAERVHYSKSHLSKIERDRKAPSVLRREFV
jgi:ribosome-binding protein aMBF1 (putative translation factor)